MGCDIHCYAEVKKNGIWEQVGNVFENPYYNPEKQNKEIKESDGTIYHTNPQFIEEAYRVRNYDLFACLANVRNGRGFAFCDTGDGFIPISEPRDLPDDCSNSIREKSDKWGYNGHSHSWILLKELLDESYWEKTTNIRGFVNMSEFKTFLRDGQPESWCGGIWSDTMKEVSVEEMKRLAESNDCNENKYYTKIQWQNTYKQSVGNMFFDETINKLKTLGEPEDVRLVFWFDN